MVRKQIFIQIWLYFIKNTNQLHQNPALFSLGEIKLFPTQSKVTPQFSSVAQSCLTLCDPVDCSMPGFPVLYCVLELAQTHVY